VLSAYIPILVVLLLAGGMAIGISQFSAILGPRKPSAVKSENFECGSEAVGSAHQRFAVKFYVVALLFVVFDVEAVFLYPWAVNFQTLRWFGFVEMAVFAATLVIALVYVWKKGALDWEN
jgi:NADH-quinone oxidoreductase subunit A